MILDDKIAKLRQKGMNICDIKNVIYMFNYKEDGLTPLMLAVIANNKDTVNTICSYYFSTICDIPIFVNLLDKEGKTALDHALYSNNKEIIQILRYSGACYASELQPDLD